MPSRASGSRAASRWASWLGRAGLVGLVAAATGATLMLAGCEFPFSVRDSEKPIGSATSVVPATEPGAVLTNLIVCVNDRKANFYIEQMTEDFIFTADPIDAATLERDYPGIFNDWTLEVESRVMGYLLDAGRCTFASLDLSNQVPLEQPTDTTYSCQVDYALALLLNADSQNYAGQARLFMRKTADNLWHIYRWEDIRPQGAQFDTWGILKGRTRAAL